jgi:hypothetical protein
MNAQAQLGLYPLQRALLVVASKCSASRSADSKEEAKRREVKYSLMEFLLEPKFDRPLNVYNRQLGAFVRIVADGTSAQSLAL